MNFFPVTHFTVYSHSYTFTLFSLQAAFLQASIAQTGQLPMPQVNSAPTIGMAGAVQPNMAIPPPGLSVPAGAAGPMGAVEVSVALENTIIHVFVLSLCC